MVIPGDTKEVQMPGDGQWSAPSRHMDHDNLQSSTTREVIMERVDLNTAIASGLESRAAIGVEDGWER